MTTNARIPFLKTETKTTHHVNWMTYAHDRPNVGLGEYLAHHILGAPEGYEIDLLEAGNDTDHSFDIQMMEHEKGGIWVQERQEIIEKLKAQYDRELAANKDVPADKAYMRKSYVGIEEYHLRTLLMAALERGWLTPGSYVVTLSW